MKKLFPILWRLLIIFICWQSVFADTLNYQITGLDDQVLTNVETRLDIMLKGFGEDLTEQNIRQFYRQAPLNILKAMQPFGYYKPEIEPALEQNGTRWTATFIIKPGTPMRISTVDLQIDGPGRYDLAFVDFLSRIPLHSGDVLLINNYQQAKNIFFDVAQHTGYLNATLARHEVNIDLDNYTAHITLHYDTGERFFFGPVNFRQKAFSEKFLRRFIHFEQGQPYATTEILELQENFNSSGYFQQIRIKPNIDQAQNQEVPIDIALRAKKSQLYTLGGGYGTDTGVRGTLAWDIRRVNEMGHQFRTYLQGSAVQSNAQAQYIIPGRNPITDQYSIGANAFDLNLGDNRSTGALFQIAAIRDKKQWLQILSLNALYERFITMNEPAQKAFVLYPELNLQRTVADNILFPDHGYSIEVSLRGGAKSLASDLNFFQVTVDGKAIYTLPTKTRLIARSDFGYTETPNIMQVPVSLQLLTGGAETIRGYSYLSLGPGRILLVLSGELQQNVWKKWYIAGFFDAGNVMDDPPFQFKRTWGLGIIRETPIGPARLYLAQVLNEARKSLRVVFSLGPDFI